ncbi:zinc ABC transporter, periplasmic-binding protein ZnuA [Hydrogenimonas sp.]|nr:zinc ABC transporter, periplasmic-binding protein ZnuA [Hydrogenimonas sp.]
MKKVFIVLVLTFSALLARVDVAVTYSYLAAVTESIGGEHVKVTVLSSPKQDPHFVVPKPSLISRLSRADMLVINGGGLEIGWLPPLLERANNPKINPGRAGFVDVSRVVDTIEKSEAVSRAYGDVHPEGNPHFYIDPHNIVPIATLIEHKLEIVDPLHKNDYAANLKRFLDRWQKFLKRFDARMEKCRGMKVVQYHELYNYFLKRYGIVSVGTIEPLPGIAPGSKHTLELIASMKEKGVKTILQDPYHEKRTARFIAAKTGARVVVLPHDLGAVEGSGTLESFYETYAERLCR